ncbi:MAG: hypothetical protein U0325_02590 [Polyangiales bacterium]
MKAPTLPVLALLSTLACKGSTQSDGVVAPPPATATPTSGASTDAGVGTPEVVAADASPAADVSPAVDASAAAPSFPLIGVRTLTFRPGARPPLGAPGAHGATVWAVTLAASAGPSPALNALFEQSQAAHLAAGVGGVGCSPAVGDAYPSSVPTGDDAVMVTVTFRNERDARRFAAALTEAPLRVGRIRFMCAD